MLNFILQTMQRIYRERTEGDYLQIYKIPFKDIRLSLKARGLLVTIFTLPDNWDFSVRGICSIIKEGRDCVLGCIRELKAYGYCKSEDCRENGKIVGEDYFFAEYPKFATIDTYAPQTENPYTENPYTENPNQYNNRKNIISINNRQKQFEDECHNYIGEFGEDMIERFISYWTEPNQKKTKMRYELQPTWDTHRRMLTWRDRNKSPEPPKQKSVDEIMKELYGN